MAGYKDIELSEPERSKELELCFKQIAEWGIKMPPVEPLPLEFGLGDFRTIGETEFWIANETESGYCGKFLFLFEGQRCPCHYHKVKHETFFILKGKLEMTVDDQPQVMNIGDKLVMPTGVRHTFLAIEPTLVLEVSMPSTEQDNFFDNKQIGNNGVI